MKIKIYPTYIEIQRKKDEKPVKNESQLLYRLKLQLNKDKNWNLIKKLMWKDGHLVSDTQHYLRSKNWKYVIWDGHYAIRNSAEDYNSGKWVIFQLDKQDVEIVRR